MSELVGGVEQMQSDDDGLEQVHQRRSDHLRADPAHGFAEEPSSRSAELTRFGIFHTEGLDDAVPGYGLLQDLIEFAEFRLTTFDRTPDAPAQFADVPQDHRKEDATSQSQFPIDV